MEAYGSWSDHVARIVVLDGESDDGTADALAQLAEVVPQLEVHSRPWPESSAGGSAIAQMTNAALGLARDGTSRLMYVQADEIYTQEQRELVRRWNEGALEFASYVNFWNALDRVLDGEHRFGIVRLLPADANATSVRDAYTFDVDAPTTTRPERVLHYGWCFPVNILRKHVNHARLYPDSAAYRLRGFLARRMLDTGTYDRELLDALAPHYRAVPFGGEHPRCMRHLFGLHAYDPYVGLEELAGGAQW